MLNDILTFDHLAKRYGSYMARMQSARFTTGLGGIDDIIRGVAPGEVLTIIAYSGTFKTALLQNLLQDAAFRSGMFQMFFSMEMPGEKVFERAIQISNQMMGGAIEYHFSNETGHKQKMIDFAKSKGCDKVLTVERSRRSLEDLHAYVDLADREYGEIQTIGIDYLGLMAAQGKDLFHKMAELSFGLKELAKTVMRPVIVLAQVNRGYAQSTGRELEMDAAKGGGDIEAGADFMFGLYRNDNEDVILKILKNRNGVAGNQFKMLMDKTSLKFLGAEEYIPPKKNKKEAPF
jgi:replicative DNA helicase